MASTLGRYQAELERLKASKASAIRRIKDKSGMVQEKAVACGTAYIVGMAEQKGKMPPDIGGIDSKLILGLVALAVAAKSNGETGCLADGISTGLLAAYSFSEGAGKGYTISGPDYTNQLGPDYSEYDDDPANYIEVDEDIAV